MGQSIKQKLEALVLELEDYAGSENRELSKAEQVIIYNLKTALKYVSKL